MIKKKNNDLVVRKFGAVRFRQVTAIFVSVLTLVLLAVLSRWPDLLGSLPRHWIARIQVLLILVFINFTAWNWKCPSCRKYLSHDISPRVCKKCGAKLQ